MTKQLYYYMSMILPTDEVEEKTNECDPEYRSMKT